MALVVIVAGVVHAWGMFRYPSMTITDDEGTYVAQAWAVVNWGQLGHYTYWYDHPPLGWIQIAAWGWITDGFHRSANAIQVGREVMLIAKMVAAAAMYVLARRLRVQPVFAAAAVLLFALSPLALHYSRMVFLDNLAVAWLLIAFALAASPHRRLAAHVGAAACFTVAVLTKETALLLLPGLVYQLLQGSDPRTRRYSATLFGSVVLLGGLLYPLFAALKNELLTGPGHVSLQYGVSFQLLNRVGSGNIFSPGSPANGVATSWIELDWVLLALGLIALPLAAIFRRTRPIAVALGLQMALLLRHGYLPDPYVIAMLPFAALVATVPAGLLWGRFHGRRRWLARGPVVATVLVVVGLVLPAQWAPKLDAQLVSDPNASFVQAQDWIKANVPRTDTLLVSDTQWVDLVEAGFAPEKVVWYFKADTDPEVQARLPTAWRDVDYVVFTADMDKIAEDPTADMQTAREARRHGRPVASFGSGNQEITVYRVDKNAA